MPDLEIRQIVLFGVMIALVAVFTLAVRVPFALTQGYFNFSDVGVFLAAFAFGPWVGLVAGGVGTAMADVVGGYAMFAPLTLVAHGLQGLVAGAVADRGEGLVPMLVGWFLGALVMVGTYFLGEAFIYGMGVAAAATEAVTINIPQVVAGGVVGIPLVFALRRGYPAIAHWGRPHT